MGRSAMLTNMQTTTTSQWSRTNAMSRIITLSLEQVVVSSNPTQTLKPVCEKPSQLSSQSCLCSPGLGLMLSSCWRLSSLSLALQHGSWGLLSQRIPTLLHSQSPPHPFSTLSLTFAEGLSLSSVVTIYSSLVHFVLSLKFKAWCVGIPEILKPHHTSPSCYRCKYKLTLHSTAMLFTSLEYCWAAETSKG